MVTLLSVGKLQRDPRQDFNYTELQSFLPKLYSGHNWTWKFRAVLVCHVAGTWQDGPSKFRTSS